MVAPRGQDGDSPSRQRDRSVTRCNEAVRPAKRTASGTSMIEFRTLGTLGLSVEGREAPTLLTQPRRLALLSYLAAATPRGLHRRDRLLTLFWPELDQEHARAALRQALHVIRASLGADALIARGDEEIGVNPERVSCDVVRFERSAAGNSASEALALYAGPFLDGFFIAEAPEFERWVEGERARLDAQARGCAHDLLSSLETAGDLRAAGDAAQQAVHLWPMEEGLIRRSIILLDAVGDRAGAVKVYEEFKGRLAADYDVAPAAETQAVMEAVRAREVTGATPRLIRPTADSPILAVPSARRRRRLGWVAAAGVSAIVLIGLGISRVAARRALDPARVAVASLENRTGDPSWTALGLLAGDWIARELLRTGMADVADRGLDIVGTSPDSSKVLNARALALNTGSGITVEGGFYRRGDSLEFEARITDQMHGMVLRSVEPVEGAARDPRSAIAVLSERITAALATVINPKLADFGNLASQPPTYAAYRELAAGADAWFDRLDAREAIPHFLQAARLDTTYTLPLVWAAWAYRGLSRCDMVDSIGRVLAGRRESMGPADAYTLEREAAYCRGDKVAVYRASQRLAAAVPGSEMAAVEFARDLLYVDEPRQALKILNSLHPDRAPLRTFTPYYLLLTTGYHMLGAHDEELRAARRARVAFPGNLPALRTEVLALAALGRVPEALDDVAQIPEQQRHTFRTPGEVMLEAALELRAHANVEAARAMLAHTLAWLASRPVGEQSGESSRSTRLNVLAAAGRWTAARALAESLAALRPDNVDYQGMRGDLAGQLGDTAEATRVDGLLAGEPSQFRGRAMYWRACLAARLGRTTDAMALLTEAEDRGVEVGRNAGGYWFMQLHTDPCFDTLHDLPGFKALLEPKG